MAKDALHRRLRTASPSKGAIRLALSEADYCLFGAIQRHGPLPSNYLYEFTKHLRRDRSHLQNRLTEFYHGDPGGSYLTRPPQQFASFNARYQHLVYDLASRGALALAEQRTVQCHIPRRSDPFVHRLMTACVGASLELTAPTLGLRYISLEEILAHSSCLAGQGGSDPLALPLPGSSQTLIPDMLFGLEYPDTGFRFFAVETDRNTESIERRDLRQSAIARKVAGYLAVLRDQSYRAWWGLPNLHVLIVTTNATHGYNILDHIRRQNAGVHEDRFALRVEPEFGSDWRVPVSLLNQVLNEPWLSASGTRSLIVP